jgi:glycosyltransferase involved in cell wall biosynthesis
MRHGFGNNCYLVFVKRSFRKLRAFEWWFTLRTPKMRIAQISPLIESVPPKLYGGTERIVSYLTEELVRQGHDVTLFASADSETAAELVPCAPKALRLAHPHDVQAYSVLQLEKIRQRAGDFDLLHFHTDYVHFPLVRSLDLPAVTTMHGRLDLAGCQPVFAEFAEMALVSISDDQRRPLHARWVATVPHGLPPDLYAFSANRGEGYLAFLGRICPEKRPDRAIEIAKRAGVQLKIAAKVDKVDQAYFEEEIRPLLGDPLIEYVGEINDGEKQAFLGGAMALLFPIDWPEPFGLVQIEAMACGTPVIAWRRGSVPEIIQHGETGFLVDGMDEAVAAVDQIRSLSREGVRRGFEKRFSIDRTAQDYVRIYGSVSAEHALLARGAQAALRMARRWSVYEKIGRRPSWSAAELASERAPT